MRSLRRHKGPPLARLEELRAMPYTDYLYTPEWRALSIEMRRRYPFCQLCGDAAQKLEVHHCRRPPRGTETTQDLIVLCEHCHELHEVAQQRARERGERRVAEGRGMMERPARRPVGQDKHVSAATEAAIALCNDGKRSHRTAPPGACQDKEVEAMNEDELYRILREQRARLRGGDAHAR